jgi:putative redox protein
MSSKTATVTLDGEGLRFLGSTGSGHTMVLDDAEGDSGARPAELVPLALAGCTAMDVISILRKKRQRVDRYEVKVRGEQGDEHPHAFGRVDVVHVVDGDVEIAALRRAIELSATKYCSVGNTLATGATEIHHSYLLRDGSGDETMGEVLVAGPYLPAEREPTTAA